MGDFSNKIISNSQAKGWVSSFEKNAKS